MAESDASIEAQLELKKRARRRLVGATALALLAAVLLPMVMDHEPRPSTQDIEIRIPDPDSGAPRLLPGKPAATPLPPVASAEAPAAAEPKAAGKPEAKARPEPQEAKPAPASAEKPAEHAAKAPEKAPAKPAAESKAEPKMPVKPAAESKAEPKAEPRSEPKPDEAPAAAKPSSTAEQWVVQLGAYKEAGNVKLLMAKLKEMGVPAYTEKFESPQGPRTRVRAGPFATKEAAEKARAKAKIVGVDGPVAPK